MNWNATAQAHLSAGGAVAPRALIWIVAKDLSDNSDFPVGFWDGADHETFTVEAQSRLYYGAQGGFRLPSFIYRPGTQVATYTLPLALSPEAVTVLRGYNLRFAPIDIHCALFDAANMSLLDIQRVFRGEVDGTPIPTGKTGEAVHAELQIVTSARRGTQTSLAKKSNESQKLRSATDTFRQYGSLGTVGNDPWGADA